MGKSICWRCWHIPNIIKSKSITFSQTPQITPPPCLVSYSQKLLLDLWMHQIYPLHSSPGPVAPPPPPAARWPSLQLLPRPARHLRRDVAIQHRRAHAQALQAVAGVLKRRASHARSRAHTDCREPGPSWAQDGSGIPVDLTPLTSTQGVPLRRLPHRGFPSKSNPPLGLSLSLW